MSFESSVARADAALDRNLGAPVQVAPADGGPTFHVMLHPFQPQAIETFGLAETRRDTTYYLINGHQWAEPKVGDAITSAAETRLVNEVGRHDQLRKWWRISTVAAA